MTFEDFQYIDLRTAKIVGAERLAGSEKLIKLQIEIGEESPRQLVAGIGKSYEPEALIGKQIVVVANLEPRKLMGEESNGMLLAASEEDGNPVLVVPEKEVKEGSKVK